MAVARSGLIDQGATCTSDTSIFEVHVRAEYPALWEVSLCLIYGVENVGGGGNDPILPVPRVGKFSGGRPSDEHRSEVLHSQCACVRCERTSVVYLGVLYEIF